jgi:hypothetical protein
MLPERPIPVPQDAIDAVVSLRDRLNAEYAGKYTVGVGLKQIGTEYTDQIAICVQVQHKKPVDDVARDELVPPEFGSYVTDVVELRPVLADDNAPYDPLRGGIQISRNSDDGVIAPPSGTLGAIVNNRGTGKAQALTNAHVVKQSGRTVFQPGQAQPTASVIGTVGALQWTPNYPYPYYLDCAVVDLDDSLNPPETSVQDIGPVQGVATQLPMLGEVVKKRGMRTSRTDGFVVAIMNTGTAPVYDQFLISGAVPFVSVWAGKGDSGSVVLNASDEVIGLLFAIHDPDLGVDIGSRGMAMPIYAVQEALQVDIAT